MFQQQFSKVQGLRQQLSVIQRHLWKMLTSNREDILAIGIYQFFANKNDHIPISNSASTITSFLAMSLSYKILKFGRLKVMLRSWQNTDKFYQR